MQRQQICSAGTRHSRRGKGNTMPVVYPMSNDCSSCPYDGIGCTYEPEKLRNYLSDLGEEWDVERLIDQMICPQVVEWMLKYTDVITKEEWETYKFTENI